MTLEDAIKHLEETLTDPAHEWCCESCKEEHRQLLTWLLELQSIRAQAEAESNDPLTLDELREMDGEPVWVILEQDSKLPFKGYGIVNADLECVLGIEFVLVFENYGEWLAYRRKPEPEV